MEVHDISWSESRNKRHNNPLLPKSIRGIIVGKSGCGKTTLLMNLLLNPGWLDYDHLYVFGKSLFQPEYKIIRKAFSEKLPKELVLRVFDLQEDIISLDVSPTAIVEEMAKNFRSKHPQSASETGIECQFYESSEDVPDPRDLNSSNKNLMVFDDLILEKQNTCEMYYVRGRHSNVDCFYLSQNYFKLPRQTIRENANFIILFPQDAKNINNIYNDHVSSDMPKEEFRKFCKKSWSKTHGFVVIDLSSKKENGKYRAGFDTFYVPSDDFE